MIPMNETTFFMDSDDGAKIFVRRCRPKGKVRAILQIAHGKGEHSGRYERLADLLVASGIEVWANDHRGHGKTADTVINPPELGGTLGHCADKNGFFRVVRDMELLSELIKEELPQLPLFLLGHSWGSFLAQSYIERSNVDISGCILSGTMGKGGIDIPVGACIASFLALLTGGRRYSPLLFTLADAAYNKPFKPNRTPFDWLSRDEKEVDAYAEDPLCGFPCSTAYYRDLARGLSHIHAPKNMARIPKNLPVFVFAGSADPVGSMGASPTSLVASYRSLGLLDLEFILYPQARHETLNETNREEVSNNLLAWIEKRIPAPLDVEN
ncbi:alpha/beta hydrolase [Treponema sp.]